MHRTLRKVKIMLIKLKVKINDLINKRKYKKKIAIISCNKWKNKVLEDIKLKYYFNKNKIGADIISWEEFNNYEKYDAIIIRSIWGFQKKDKEFKKWLNFITKSNITIFNEPNIIIENNNKEKQFKLLNKYNIKCIDTDFVKNDNNIIENIKNTWNNKFTNYKKLVLKPTISESGENTFIINKDENINIKFDNLIANSKLMVQPFIDEIKDGEYSIIYINNKLSHCVIRFPGILNNIKKIEYINTKELDKKLLKISDSINNIKEFKNSLYMRIDFVKHKDEYLVLEVELIDPILFINSINNKNERKNAYNLLVSETINRLNKK